MTSNISICDDDEVTFDDNCIEAVLQRETDNTDKKTDMTENENTDMTDMTDMTDNVKTDSKTDHNTEQKSGKKPDVMEDGEICETIDADLTVDAVSPFIVNEDDLPSSPVDNTWDLSKESNVESDHVSAEDSSAESSAEESLNSVARLHLTAIIEEPVVVNNRTLDRAEMQREIKDPRNQTAIRALQALLCEVVAGSASRRYYQETLDNEIERHVQLEKENEQLRSSKRKLDEINDELTTTKEILHQQNTKFHKLRTALEKKFADYSAELTSRNENYRKEVMETIGSY